MKPRIRKIHGWDFWVCEGRSLLGRTLRGWGSTPLEAYDALVAIDGPYRP